MVHIGMCWGCLWAIVGAVCARSGWLVCLRWLSFVMFGGFWSKTWLVLGCALVVFCEFCVDMMKEWFSLECVGGVFGQLLVQWVPDLVGWCVCFGCIL